MSCHPQILQAWHYERHASQGTTNDRVVKDVELDFISGGSGTITVNGVPYRVSRGVLMLRLPGDLCHSVGGYTCSTLTLNFSDFYPLPCDRHRTGDPQILPEDFPLKNVPTVLTPEPFSAYEDLFRAVRTFLSASKAREADDCVSELLLRMQADALRITNRQAEHQTVSALHPAVRQVMEWLDAHYRESFTLADLARITGYHPGYLHRLFLRQCKCTPREYQERLRLNRAAFLLRDSSDPIVWIADSCGFSSASYFTQIFRKVYGIPPNEYRRQEEK